MDIKQILGGLSNLLLRLGIIVFLIPVFLDFWNKAEFAEDLWLWFFRILYIIIYIIIAALVLFLRRLKFYNFGFAIVLIASVYEIVDSAFKYGFTMQQPVYIFLITVSFYFLTKSEIKKKRVY